MKKIPLELIHYCKFLNKDNKIEVLPFLISKDNVVEMFTEKHHKSCDIIENDVNLHKTLSYMINGDFKLEDKIHFYDAMSMEEYLNNRVDTSETHLARALEYLSMYANTEIPLTYYEVPKRKLLISEKKIKKYTNELAEVENNIISQEKEREF